jgi:uncharacterized protein DUF4190
MPESTRKQPVDGSYVSEDGRIHGFIPNIGWVPTGDNASPELLARIRQPGAITSERSRKGEPLYRDPRVNYLPIPRPPEVPRVNGLATTARVFSWLGLLALPFGTIGLILGYMALGRIASNDAESRSVAKTAIIVGWIFTVILVVLVFLILDHK